MSSVTKFARALAAVAALAAGSAFAQVPPPNDLCPQAEELTVPTTGTLTTPTLTNLNLLDGGVEAPMGCGATAQSRSVWYSFVAPASGAYNVSTCGTTNFDSVLQVYSGAACGALTQVGLACNDDGCTGSTTTSASQISRLYLAQGERYWVQIAGYDGTSITATSALALSISFLAAPPANDACVNAVSLPASATPRVTVSSNPVLVLGAAPAPDVNPLSCSTNSKNDVWYSFTAPVTAQYRVDTCGTSTNYDTVLALYSGTSCGGLTALACNDTGSSCTTGASAVTVSLTAGTTYFAQIAAYSSSATTLPTLTAASQTFLNVTQLQAAPGDVCSSAIPLGMNTPTVAMTAVADAGFALANDDARVPSACYAGVGNATTVNDGPGRDVVLSFTPPANNRYNVRVSGLTSTNSVVYLTNTCTAAATPPYSYTASECVAAVNRATSSTSSHEDLACVQLTGGTPYYLWVDESTAASTSGGRFEVEVTACFPETEPNNLVAEANALACPISGSINAGTTPGADVDFFSIGSTGGTLFALVDGTGSSTNLVSATDFDMRVTTAVDTLEFDNSDGDTITGASSPVIAGTTLPAGVNTYLRVNYASTTSAREPYRLYSVVQPSAPTVEVEPNDSVATANAAPSNYFRGTMATSTDADFYAFDARAGDLVFLALDGLPGRAATTSAANHAIELRNATGVIVDANGGLTTVSLTASAGVLTGSTPTFPSEGLVYRIRTSGTYYVRVYLGTTTPTGPTDYQLSIAIGCAPGGGIGAPVPGALTPATGTVSGGTLLTLTGSGFVNGTTITLGGSAATVVSVTPTSLTFRTPAGNEGVVDLVVTNPGYPAVTVPGAFTYFIPPEPPTIASVVPGRGPVTGGRVVNVNGLLFKPDASVSFSVNGVELSATNVTVNNSTLITATTPAHQEGLAVVRVINTDGFEAFLDAGYLYDGYPEVSSIDPNVGSSDGGQTITVEGRNFRTGATVRLGANLATLVTIADGGFSLTARTPASVVNTPVDVIVANTDGLVVTIDGGYTYFWPAPRITSISPTAGMVDGGTTITITGTGFQPTPTVTIGGVPATTVNRVSLTSVTAVSPEGLPGPVDVVLTNTDSKSSTLVAGFTYQGWPSVASITPNAGFTSGGQLVTITGNEFRAPAAVFFGANAGTSVTVADGGMSLTVLTPTSTINTAVNVTVRNNDTNQSATVTNGYTYEFPTPTITALSVRSGFTAGGTTTVITGTGFQAGVTVTIGGTAVATLNRSSTTSITVTTPPGAAGLADVVVTNVDAKTATLTGGFRFVPPPQLTSITPDHGPTQGGTLITLSGQDFLAGATVSIGGVPAFAVNVTSPTTATAVTNTRSSGPADVTLTNPDTQASTRTAGFTYDPAPTITEASPVTGTIAGGTVVTLKGTGFLAGAQVLFGNTAATNVMIVSPTELKATTPARPVGVVSITVRNADGQLSELPRAYRFVAPPVLTALAPATGDAAGGTVVTLTGSGFSASAQVTFGGASATRVSFVSATELEAEAPAHAPGAVDVTVDVDGATATLAAAFTYERNAPTLSAVAPVSGPIAGGTLLTLAGTGFAQGMTVTVGGTPATDVVVVSSVLARAVAPAHAAGAVDVVVTNDDQKSATLAGAFTYVTPPTEGGGTLTDGGTGALGEDPVVPTPNPGGVSCGCSAFDPSSLSLAGLGVLMVLSRRRRRS